MKQLSAIDTFFLHGETPTQSMNLTGVGIYDPSTRATGAVHFDEIVRYGADRTRRSGLFRRRLQDTPWLNQNPYWTEDEGFDVRNHVFHATLPAPGGRAELDQEIARIHARQIDRAHALWEWWFIDGLDGVEGVPPGAFALLFKLHHAAFDGVAGWEVIDVSHDKEPGYRDAAPDAAPPAAESGPRPSSAELAMQAYAKALEEPIALARALWSAMPIASKAVSSPGGDSPLSAPRAPQTSLNGPLTGGQCHRKVAVSLGDLKLMRTLVDGATVNDVVLAIIGGALRRYFEEAGSLPDNSLNVGMPVSIRSKGDEASAGNQAMLSILPLGTDVADPVERLAGINERTSRKKNFVNENPVFNLLDLFEHVPGFAMRGAVNAFTKLKAARWVQLPYNLIVTNVPASRTPIYFAGAKMVEYDACGPIWDGVGLIHVVTSYLDQVNISFNADTALMTDPDQYERCVIAARDEMIACARAVEKA